MLRIPWSGVILLGSLAGPAWLAAGESPWTETFPMTVAGRERTFVSWRGEAWMQVTPTELMAGALSSEIMLPAKVQATPARGGRLAFYGLAQVEVSGPAEVLAAVIEEDNVYVLATVRPGLPVRLQIRALIPAPGDRDLIAQRLAAVGATDWEARLAAVRWIRAQASQQGNRDFWLSQADLAFNRLVADAVAAAATARQAALVERAMAWCIDEVQDTGRAASAASQAWLGAADPAAAERIGQRMRGLGYAPYQDQWLPRTEALSREFEDRWARIDAQDAEAYYRLGRWADTQGELLPRYKERTWRCFQAGLAIDSRHPGIRRELGLPPVEPGVAVRRPDLPAVAGPGAPAANEAAHPSGVRIAAPLGWKMTLSGSGYEFTSELAPRAMITVAFMTGITDWDSLAAEQLARTAQRPGYRAIGAEERTALRGLTVRRSRFAVTGERGDAGGQQLVVSSPTTDVGIVIQIEDGEQPERTQEALQQSLESAVFPAAP